MMGMRCRAECEVALGKKSGGGHGEGTWSGGKGLMPGPACSVKEDRAGTIRIVQPSVPLSTAETDTVGRRWFTKSVSEPGAALRRLSIPKTLHDSAAWLVLVRPHSASRLVPQPAVILPGCGSRGGRKCPRSIASAVDPFAARVPLHMSASAARTTRPYPIRDGCVTVSAAAGPKVGALRPGGAGQ